MTPTEDSPDVIDIGSDVARPDQTSSIAEALQTQPDDLQDLQAQADGPNDLPDDADDHTHTDDLKHLPADADDQADTGHPNGLQADTDDLQDLQTQADHPKDLITCTCLPQHTVSREEAEGYYAGLLSPRLLIYRTGTTPWRRPTGPEARPMEKEFRSAYGHPSARVWEDNLGLKICNCLDLHRVDYATVSLGRFAYEEEALGPVVLWIEVMPKSLSGHDAYTAAAGCLKVLESYELTDVEVELSELKVSTVLDNLQSGWGRDGSNGKPQKKSKKANKKAKIQSRKDHHDMRKVLLSLDA